MLLNLNNFLFVLYFKTKKMLILGVCFILYFLQLSRVNMVACCIRKNLCFNARALHCKEIEKIIFDIILPEPRPITICVFYRPPSQSNFMELIVKDFSHLNLKDNEVDLLLIFFKTEITF